MLVMRWKRECVMERQRVQSMVIGRHGAVGQYAHQPVLVDVDIEIELVPILRHPMVVYPVLVQP